jgi:hypothetical protein
VAGPDSPADRRDPGPHRGLTPDRVSGVFLVGGSSRIPLVPTMLHRLLGIAPTVMEQPELVVAQGSLHAVPRTADADATFVLAAAWAPEPGDVGVATLDVAPVSPARPTSSPPSVSPPPPAPEPRSVSPAPAAAAAPSSGSTTSDSARQPASSKRRLIAIVAGTLLAVVTAAVIVALVNRRPALTEQGKRNANVFVSAPLRSFADRWLNDSSKCESKPPNQEGGTATELVTCSGGTWAVNFRAYANTANRNYARVDRRTYYQKENEADLTGQGPESGVRIDYVQEGYVVIYWDDENSLVSGDLFSNQMDRAALARVWAAHVE